MDTRQIVITPSLPPLLPVNGAPAWLRFALLCALFLLAALWLEPHLALLCRATAAQVGALLGLAGYAPLVQGDLVVLPGFSVRIITECTSLYACLLYAAFVLAQPASWRRTLAALLLGTLAITAANLLRISFVTAVGPVVPPFVFEILHVYLGQVAMLLLVVAAALAWLRWSAAGLSPFPFLLRAGCCATALFLPWLLVNARYVRALDSLVSYLFSLSGYRLIIPYQHTVYYQTFNSLILVSLIVAEQRFTSRQKLLRICCGIAVLALVHTLFRMVNVLMTAFDWPPAFGLTTVLSIIGEYLLPFLFWRYASGSANHSAG